MNEDMKMLKQAVEISTENIPLRVYYVERLLGEKAGEEEILSECEELLKHGSNQKQALLSAGKTYFRFQRYEKAIYCMSLALSLPNLNKAEKADAYKHLGDCYVQIEETDKAFEAWEKAKQYQPEEVEDTTGKRKNADEPLPEKCVKPMERNKISI